MVNKYTSAIKQEYAEEGQKEKYKARLTVMWSIRVGR